MTALQFHHCYFHENILGRLYPFHGNRIATGAWASNLLSLRAVTISDHTDLPASNDFAANEAITFFVERSPLPEFIEASQDAQFLAIRYVAQATEHVQNIRTGRFSAIRRSPDSGIG
jgi:hypothetical protein